MPGTFRREVIWIAAAMALLAVGVSSVNQTSAFARRALRVQGVVAEIVTSVSDSTRAIIRFQDPHGRTHELVRGESDLLGATHRDAITVLFDGETGQSELANHALIWRWPCVSLVACFWLSVTSGNRMWRSARGLNVPRLSCELLMRPFSIFCNVMWSLPLVEGLLRVATGAPILPSKDMVQLAMGAAWLTAWALFGLMTAFLPDQPIQEG